MCGPTIEVVTAWRVRRFHVNSVCVAAEARRGPGRKPWRRPWGSAVLMPGAGLVWNVVVVVGFNEYSGAG